MKLTYLYQNTNKLQGIFLSLVLFCLPSIILAQAEVRRSSSVEDKVEQLEKQLATANRMRAEFQFQLTNLQKEVRDLRGIIEEQAYQIEQITGRQRDIYRDLDQYRNQQPAGQTNTSANLVNTDSRSAVNPITTPPSVPSSNVSDADIRAQYDAIFPLVRAKRFDEAIVEYQKFIAAYPDSEYIANSRYWLAQIFNVQGRTDEAEREYLLVSQQYPDAAKAPDALLKLGELYEKRGQNPQAIEYYQQLLNNYPESNPARFAQARIEELGS